MTNPTTQVNQIQTKVCHESSFNKRQWKNKEQPTTRANQIQNQAPYLLTVCVLSTTGIRILNFCYLSLKLKCFQQ